MRLRSIMRGLRELFMVADTAENLAVFRIVVALLVVGSRDLQLAPQVAALPVALRSAPDGAGELLNALPLSISLVRIGVGLVTASALFGLVGLRARAAFSIATGAGFFTLGVSQLGGAVWHCHHLLWFCALLAASPCSDALSVDSWWKSRRERGAAPQPAVAYGLPLRVAWALLAIILFFPGVWKLRGAGLAWIWSDNLRNQMHWKWLQLGGHLPWPRIDRSPLLCRVLAAMVVLFELSFPALVFPRRSRMIAIGAALLFYLGAWLYMGIDYSNLWPCYVVFVNWTPLFDKLRRGARSECVEAPRAIPKSGLLPTGIVGGALIFGSVFYGASGRMRAWPFACYPTFQWLAPAHMPVLLVEAIDQHGQATPMPGPWQLGPHAGPRGWALNWSALGVSLGSAGRPPDPARLRAYWDYLHVQPEAARLLSAVCAIHFYRALLPVSPESWTASPPTRTLLYRLPVPSPSCGS